MRKLALPFCHIIYLTHLLVDLNFTKDSLYFKPILQFALDKIEEDDLDSSSVDRIVRAVADAYEGWRRDTGKTSPESLDAAFIESMMSRVIQQL
jgi:hypothetical protein